jgi:colicin import membrane protein
MSATAPSRRPRHRWHAPEKGSGPAFALSLLAHAILFIAIAFMVRWKSEPVGTVSAELWSLPPAAVQQPTPMPPPRPAQVEPPKPEPRKAEIVMEQKKAPPKAEPKKRVDPELPKKVEAKAAQIEKPPDPNAAVQRALAQAQRASVAVTGPTGGGLSDGYAAQIRGCIRPHIIFNVPEAIRPQQHVAEFEVMLLPTGEQATDPKLLKASGLAAYDQAVERAIRRCNPFPPPKEGTMPRSLRLSFDPVETR